MAAHKKTISDYERAAVKVNGCWIYATHGVARIVYLMRHGPLPKGVNVCHTCDNQLCIRDSHHFPGTQKENVQDSISKGRFASKARSLAAQKRASNPKELRKLRANFKKLYANPEFLKLKKEGMKAAWANPVFRSKQIAIRVANGKKQASTAAFKNNQIQKFKEIHNDPAWKAKASANMRRLWADPAFRKRRSDAAKLNIARLWADPNFRRIQTKANAQRSR